jgi:hypothetical protein
MITRVSRQSARQSWPGLLCAGGTDPEVLRVVIDSAVEFLVCFEDDPVGRRPPLLPQGGIELPGQAPGGLVSERPS